MKRILSVLVVFGLVMAFACGGGGDDVKSVMEDFLSTFGSFVDKMEKAESADAVASAMEDVADAFKSLVPRMIKLKESNPDFDFKSGKLGEDFKELEARLKAMNEKMDGMRSKFMKYMSDPKVMAALKKFMEAMKGMEK